MHARMRATESVTFRLPAIHRDPLVAVAYIRGHAVKLGRPKVDGRHAVSQLTARAMIKAKIEHTTTGSRATARLFAHGHRIAETRFMVRALRQPVTLGHRKNHAGNGGSTTPSTIASPSTSPSTTAGGGTSTGTGTSTTTTGTTGGGISQPVTSGADAPLLWAPPTNANPTTINVTTAEEADPYQLTLSTTQDYIVNLPNSDFLGALKIWGGHNVTIIGGHITVPNSATQNDNAKDGSDVGLRIHGSTGTVHIEGVLLDCQNPASTQCDAINIDAPLANVQIENVRADDLWGTYSDAAGGAADTGEHADAIETWGGANSLDVDNFTATGDYQGFTIESELGTTVNSYDLRNVNLVNEPVPSALASISRGGGNMLIVSSYDTACTKQGPMSLSNFYIDDESNGYVSPGNQVWPHVGSTYGCPGVMSGNNVTWPALTNITGHVTLSAPPSGDFVPTGVAGTSYVSPGYTS
jgi:hypothetical protein